MWSSGNFTRTRQAFCNLSQPRSELTTLSNGNTDTMKNDLIRKSFLGLESLKQGRLMAFVAQRFCTECRTRHSGQKQKPSQRPFRCACCSRSASLLLSRRFGGNIAQRAVPKRFGDSNCILIMECDLVLFPAWNTIVPARVRQSEATRTQPRKQTSFLSACDCSWHSFELVLTVVLALAL